MRRETAKAFAESGEEPDCRARRTENLKALKREVKGAAPHTGCRNQDGLSLSVRENAYQFLFDFKDFQLETGSTTAGFGNYAKRGTAGLGKIDTMAAG